MLRVKVHRKLSKSETFTGNVEPLNLDDLPGVSPSKHGWFFDWRTEFNNPRREVYKLIILGSPDIQGLISFEYDEGFVLVRFLESSPDNRNRWGLFIAHPLLAFVCMKSFESGNDGIVCIESKINPRLIRYYESLGARYIGNNRLVIFELESIRLRKLYLMEGE
ncbi:hypothetical protein DCC39_06835 [Pueribacillus theae]|uniref:GNAT family N-acetyltransferase n=1 Tax=Pueribacillus theae TaxID=2171751 RepID=A0A2U1K474_9BACI|nr:hypothetical protein [Pueribacillus theae]PWA12327.1 hypothetical protein DCC39_06835 [Pueribacillus theae]